MATVQRRGETYRIRSSVGYDVKGKQLIRSFTWKPAPGMTDKQIKKELERQCVLFDEQCQSCLCLDTNISLYDFCEKWLAEYAEPNLAPKTVAGYRDKLRRVYTALGHLRISKIKPAHIMEFYQNLREAGLRGDTKYAAAPALNDKIKEKKLTRKALAEQTELSEATIYQAVRGGLIALESADKIAGKLGAERIKLFTPVGVDKPLSDKTIYEYHRLLHVILKTAMHWQYISQNPCDMVTPPKSKKKEAGYLDEVQTAQLIKCLQGEPIKPATMIKMLIYSGLRRGELCGLFWEDIDFKKKLITVRRTSQYLPGKGIFDKETKTEASNRTIKLPDLAFDALSEYRAWQNEQRLRMGDRWENTGRIFCDDYGKAISPEFITQWFSKFVRRKDLPNIHIHSLRHPYVKHGLKICN